MSLSSPVEAQKAAEATSFNEVEANAVTICWKCRGSGTKLIKDPAKADSSPDDAVVATGHKEPVLITVACPVCEGTGRFGRKRKRPEERAARPLKEFPGWEAVGPEPLGPQDDTDLDTRPDEDLCFLVGKWRIFQQRDTHRYSTDDVVTAWVAARCAGALMDAPAAPLQCLDIGCGIGSVLMMVAWLLPTSICKGVEAQSARAAQAVRSIKYNGIGARVSVLCGDLRDPASTPEGPIYDLITGTPPYFNVKEGALPGSEESARCLFEYRGGIEEYSKAAARLMKPNGLFVVVESALGLERGYTAAKDAGLRVIARLDAIPKAGKPALFTIFVMEKPAVDRTRKLSPETFQQCKLSPYSPAVELPSAIDAPDVSIGLQGELLVQLVIRDRTSERTQFYQKLLAELGKPS